MHFDALRPVLLVALSESTASRCHADLVTPASSIIETRVLRRKSYERMFEPPSFPKLILKVLALNAGPGKRFISQLLEGARVDRDRRLQQLKAQTGIDLSNQAEVLHVAFVSLTLPPCS